MTNEESGEDRRMDTDPSLEGVLDPNKSPPQTESNRNVYAESDEGPYIVLLESKDKVNHPIGKLHIMGIGRRLWNAKVSGLLKTEKAGQNRVKLTFKTKVAANSFLTHDVLTQENWEAYIPFGRIFKKGIIFGVDPVETEEDILRGIQSEIQVSSVRRIKKMVQNAKVDTSVVEITFLGQQLPYNVRIYTVPYKVKLSVPNPFLCAKCYRFGHKSEQCRSQPRCKNCGKEGEALDNCKEKCERRCVNCSSKDHCASDIKECPEFNIQKEVKRVMAERNLPYHVANKLVKGMKEPQIGYANIASISDFPALSEIRRVKETSQNKKAVAPIRLNKRKAPEIGEEWSIQSPSPSLTSVQPDWKQKRPRTGVMPSTTAIQSPNASAQNSPQPGFPSENIDNFFHSYVTMIFKDILRTNSVIMPEKQLNNVIKQYFGSSIMKQLGLQKPQDEHAYASRR